MAKIVNTTPGDYQTPLAPGSPSVFSVKCDTAGAMVDLSTIESRYGLTGVAHRQENGVGVVPDLAGYPAAISLASPEHRSPVSSAISCTPNGAGIRLSGEAGSIVAGVYELEAVIPVRGAVAASVTFDFDSSWSASTRYWVYGAQALPLYVGLEYGPTRTGVFVGFSNTGTGRIVAGGPSQNFTGPRPGQRESQDLGWLNLSDHDRMTVYLVVDESNDVATVYYQDTGVPVPAVSFTLSELGNFATSASGHSLWRDVASPYARLFFGHGGPSAVTVLDYELYPYAPMALRGGEAGAHHTVLRRPDLPVLYRVAETGLPSSELLSRWSQLEGDVPALSSYYLPGKKSSPYKAVLTRNGSNPMGLFRTEPHLEDSRSFSVEAVLDASDVYPVGHNSGIGIDVSLDSEAVKLRLLSVGASKRLGILMSGGDPISSAGYYLSTDEVDWSSLTAVRVVYAPNMAGDSVLTVHAGDTAAPTISVTNPLLPATTTPGRIAVGHLDNGAYAGALGVSSITYANEFDAWELGEATPPAGTGTAPLIDATGRMVISKTFGSSTAAYYSLAKKSLYQRGMFIEFRGRLVSYADARGIGDAPNVWTGAGITVFFGSTGTPDGTVRKLHLGFFDCGIFGRRVAILPGAGGSSDVIRQTKRGTSHSARVDWAKFHTYRLVYLPNDRIEVWVDDLTTEPAFRVPWAQFFAERDTLVPDEPSLSFGLFNPSISGVTEWEFLRSGFSTGYEFFVRQDPTLGDRRDVKDLSLGRELTLIEAEDVVP